MSFKFGRPSLEEVAASDQVRRALRARAALVLPRAQREAAQAGRLELAKRLRIEEGTRPGTKAGGFRRTYARVIAVYPEEARKADARSKLTGRAILRRAAR